jgi:hypothetical protein
MSKTFFGYTEKKLQEKADKRGISFDSYKNYVQFKRRCRKSPKQRRLSGAK